MATSQVLTRPSAKNVKVRLEPLTSPGGLHEDYLRELLTTMGDRFKDEDVDEMYKEAPIKNGMFDYVEFTRYTYFMELTRLSCFSWSTGIKTDKLEAYYKENLLPLALTPPPPHLSVKR